MNERRKGLGEPDDYDSSGRLKIGPNGELPDSIRSKPQSYVDSTAPIQFDTSSPAPWEKFDMARVDLGWRMGAGEEYLVGFSKWYEKLPKEVQRNYRETHPEPDEWSGFFDELSAD